MKKAILLVAALAVLSGCGGSASTDPFGFATLRVINAAATNSNVDFDLDGTVLATTLPRRQAAPADGTVPRQFESGAARVTATTFGASGGTINRSFTMEADSTYTAIFAGRPGATGTDAPRILLNSDLRANLLSSQANLRFVHAAPAVNAVDLYITTTTADLAGLTPNVTNLPRYGGSGLIRLNPGTWRIRVTPTGTKTPSIDVTGDFSAGIYSTVVIENNDANTGGLLTQYGAGLSE